jgi:hypothetical protein
MRQYTVWRRRPRGELGQVDTIAKPVYCYAPRPAAPPGQRRQASRTERLVRQRFWSAIFTDVQFWVPVLVLALGVGLLLSLR